MKLNKTNQVAKQKVWEESQPLPEGFTLPKLTADQRKAIYAPRPYTEAPEHLQGSNWVATWKGVSKATFGFTAFLSLIFGGLIAKESKKGIKL